MIAACALLLALAPAASAHSDPFEPAHLHTPSQSERGGGTSPLLAVGIAAMMLATAGALIVARRVGR